MWISLQLSNLLPGRLLCKLSFQRFGLTLGDLWRFLFLHAYTSGGKDQCKLGVHSYIQLSSALPAQGKGASAHSQCTVSGPQAAAALSALHANNSNSNPGLLPWHMLTASWHPKPEGVFLQDLTHAEGLRKHGQSYGRL